MTKLSFILLGVTIRSSNTPVERELWDSETGDKCSCSSFCSLSRTSAQGETITAAVTPLSEQSKKIHASLEKAMGAGGGVKKGS